MTIPELYQHFLNSTGVSIDTRSITEGNIYFALKGESFNGNKFAQKAIESGAILAVIDEPEYENNSTVQVTDVLETLQALAKYHREQLKIPIIGLTGSNGKTTTKELIHQVLSAKYNTLATAGNFNNHIGVPLSLLRIRSEHEMAIIEMGANHQKEIEFLCSMSQPDIGYITNFGKAHLEGFGGVEGVIKGKSELYQYLRSNSKTALVNADDPIQVEKSSGIKIIDFGKGEKVNYNFPESKDKESEDLYVSATYEGLDIQSKLTGIYNLNNIHAAICLGLHFEIDILDIKKAIEAYDPSNNRSQVSRTEHNTLIVDAYNANPSSMEQAVINMDKIPGRGKWLILGDMFEMGDYEAEEHQKLVNLIAEKNFEQVILVGEAFHKTDHKNISFNTTDELLAHLTELKPRNKTILIKGSRGMKLERSIPLL